MSGIAREGGRRRLGPAARWVAGGAAALALGLGPTTAAPARAAAPPGPAAQTGTGGEEPRQQAAGDPAAPAPEPGSELTIYLLTFGPGQAVWEVFGHNGIWVRDTSARTDVAYDYGRFDFAQERFILRFMRGQMLYWMEPQPADWMLWAYGQADRDISVQELALTPAQRLELKEFLEWNAREENRFYRYDYYRDNCSTRVRDALDRVLGGALRRQLEGQPTGTTYRSHTQRLTAHLPAINAGLLLALGQPTDQPLSAWDEGFIPMKLAEHVRSARVPLPGGGSRPLVADEQVLHAASAAPPPEAPPNRIPAFLALGVLAAASLLGLGALAPRRRWARPVLAAGGALWAVLWGLLGTVILGLWLLTEHEFTYRNENVLQANPVGLALALLIPLALLGRGRAARAALGLALAAAGLSLLGAVAQVLPAFSQTNGEIVALALPLHVGLAGALVLALKGGARG